MNNKHDQESDNKYFPLSEISPGNVYQLFIQVPSDVGSLCLEHNYVINAKLIFKCQLSTPSPTAPLPTVSPNTLAPTVPTMEPTVDTINPTPYPTHAITDCGEHRHCYHISIDIPSVNNDTLRIVKIQNIDESANVYYHILFNISGNDCIDPTLSFSYELVTYF